MPGCRDGPPPPPSPCPLHSPFPTRVGMTTLVPGPKEPIEARGPLCKKSHSPSGSTEPPLVCLRRVVGTAVQSQGKWVLPDMPPTITT